MPMDAVLLSPPALDMALILQWSFHGLVDICLPSLDLLPTSELVVGFLDVCLDQICDFQSPRLPVHATACLLGQCCCSISLPVLWLLLSDPVQ